MRKQLLTFAILLLGGGLFAQRGNNIKFANDGKGYYAIENNAIVEYSLPGFQRSVVVDAAQLTPAGSAAPLLVQGYTFTDDGKKLLIFTNSKKVWRQNTRGDYWLLDVGAHTLRQLGKSRPPSSL